MAHVACFHILLGLNGKGRRIGIVRQSSQIQPEKGSDSLDAKELIQLMRNKMTRNF